MKNLLLAVVSLVLALVLSVVADRVLGAFVSPPVAEGQMELIFPPGSEQTFATGEFTYTARTNSLGLRNHEIGPKESGICRIVAIGDSFTYGWGVEIEQTWLKLLEANLRDAGVDAETINVGKPGTGPPFYAEISERAIPLFEPDIVIVAMLQGNDLAAAGPETGETSTGSLFAAVRALYPNATRWVLRKRSERDLEANRQPLSPPRKSTAEDNRRWQANTAKEFLDKMEPEHRARYDAFEDAVKEAFLAGNLNPYMIDLAMKSPNFYTSPLNLDDPWILTCVERMAARLGHIKKIANNYGARVIVLSVPHGPYVNYNEVRNIQRVGYEGDDSMVASGAPDDGIRMACERAGVPFHEVTAAFRERADDTGLYYELDEHFTPAGHKLYADSITPILKQIAAD